MDIGRRTDDAGLRRAWNRTHFRPTGFPEHPYVRGLPSPSTDRTFHAKDRFCNRSNIRHMISAYSSQDTAVVGWRMISARRWLRSKRVSTTLVLFRRCQRLEPVLLPGLNAGRSYRCWIYSVPEADATANVTDGAPTNSVRPSPSQRNGGVHEPDQRPHQLDH